jgi:hypothetical protein
MLACLALAGCGARSPLEGASPSEDRPRVEDPGERFDCRVSASARPMLAARLGSRLVFAYPDRSTREVFSFELPEGAGLRHGGVIARGDRVAAYIVGSPGAQSDEPAPFAEVVVLGVDGALLAHERRAFAYEGWGSESHLAGNAEGVFALTLLEVKAGLGLVIDDAGTRPFSERMAGRSDPDARGRMVVMDYEASSTAALHFFDTQQGSFWPSHYVSDDLPGEHASSPTVVGAGLLYLQHAPARLVFEDASGVLEQPIDVALSSPGHATPGYGASGGWRVFMLGGSSVLEARYLTTHFASGELHEFRLSPPPGQALPGDYWNPPRIDPRGRLLLPLWGAGRVQLHATKDGQSWSPIGKPITESGYPTKLAEAGGTVIFEGWGGDMALPGTLPPWAAQLVGPEGGEGIELVRADPGGADNPTYAEDAISGDGACVAYFRSGSLHVIDVATYSSSDLGLSTEAQSAEMAWIPLPP